MKLYEYISEDGLVPYFSEVNELEVVSFEPGLVYCEYPEGGIVAFRKEDVRRCVVAHGVYTVLLRDNNVKEAERLMVNEWRERHGKL